MLALFDLNIDTSCCSLRSSRFILLKVLRISVNKWRVRKNGLPGAMHAPRASLGKKVKSILWNFQLYHEIHIDIV
jgi:hypothetical protein